MKVLVRNLRLVVGKSDKPEFGVLYSPPYLCLHWACSYVMIFWMRFSESAA